MKKLLIGSNVIWATLFLFMAFKGPSFETLKENEPDNLNKDFNGTTAACTPDAFTGISLGELLQGIARYRKTHWDSVNLLRYMRRNSLEDARCCWYSLDTLKKYICVIEAYSKQLGLASNNLGIRFYYAVYADTLKKYAEYKSHHTLFLVPTFLDSSASVGVDNQQTYFDVDFDPRYSIVKHTNQKFSLQEIYQAGDSTYNILTLDALTANNKPQFGINKAAGLAARNQGQLCPPTCVPPLTSFAFGEKEIFSFAKWNEMSSKARMNLLDYVDNSIWVGGLSWKQPK
jgi:hypothetical protein